MVNLKWFIKTWLFLIWWSQKFSVFIYSVTVSVDFICHFQMASIYTSIIEQKLNLIIGSLLITLRRQPTFGDATTGFPAKWCLRNEHRNSILMTSHFPDLGSDTSSVWNFCACFSEVIWRGNSGSVAKCWLFFQVNCWFKIFPQLQWYLL